MRGNAKRKGVFLSLLISYISFLFIILAINIYAYYQAVNIIENEINRAHEASLKQVQQVIDSRLVDIKRLANQIALNQKVSGLIGYGTSIGPQQIFNMTKVIEDIRMYKVANAFIDQLYIYYKDCDVILSQYGKCTYSEFYNFYCTDYGQSYNDWYRMLNKGYGNSYMTSGDDSSRLKGKIIFIKAFPIENIDSFNGAVVFTMNENTLKSTLKDMGWLSQGIVMLVNPNNNSVISTKESGISDYLRYDKMTGEQGSFYQIINGAEFAVSYVKSDISGWKHISIVPTQVFLDKAKYIKGVIAVCSLLCLLIGGLVAFIWSRKNYNPVKRMVDLLANRAGIPVDNKKNEFSFIEQSILHVLKEKDELNKQLKNQKDALRDNFLARLVKGNLKNSASIQDVGRHYNINFEYDYFTVIIFNHIDESKNIFFEQTGRNADKALEITYFIIRNVVEELIHQNAKGYMFEVDNLYVCIANFMESDDVREITGSVINVSRSFVKEQFGIAFNVSVSGVHKGHENIQTAYQEAVDALEHNTLADENRIIYYDDIDISNTLFHNPVFKKQQKFINAVMADEFGEAEEILGQIIEEDFSQSRLPVQMLKYRMFGIVNMMIMSMDKVNICYGDEFWARINPMKSLLECNTTDELKKQMLLIIKQMKNYSVEERRKQNVDLFRSITAFVKDNYANINLSVSMIAEEFKINSSYLSRLFKKYKGTGLLDYIHSVRINKAKRLIKDSGFSLKEISEKVGYYNNIAFIRAFKRQEGICPGQYRDFN